MGNPDFVVLDRDGTIIVERDYLSDPGAVELLPTAAEGLRQLRSAGLGLVVITNQSAVGRGIITEARLAQIHQRLEHLLEREGVFLDGIYFCPHLPDDGCSCRKPNTGLLQAAQAPGAVELLPTAAEGLRQLRSAGLGLVVITNQSAVGRGIITEARLAQIHQRLEHLLEREGVFLDGIYFCPHLPDDGCSCRKPNTGLLQAAALDHGFDPRRSFVIGDKATDIEMGQNVGATTILVRTGYGEELARSGMATPSYTAGALGEAAQYILNEVDPRLRSIPGEARQ